VSNKKLLVNTGSSYSLFPFRSACKQSGPRLKAANGQRICCWGSRRWALLLDGILYQWHFLQADVSFPILGVDFLCEFQLLVDVIGGRLVPRSSVAASGDGDVFAVFQSQPNSTPSVKTYAEAVKGIAAGSSRAAGSSEAPIAAGELAAAAAAVDWEQILAEFPGVTQLFTIASSPTHGVQHRPWSLSVGGSCRNCWPT
jgi:hypothetical protein